MTGNYLLVDGVMMPHACTELLAYDGVEEIIPLYLGTPWAEIKERGPLLVKSPPGSELLAQVLAGTHDWPIRASVLFSDAASNVVARHLRHFVAPDDALGGKGLLRFADPLVTAHWLGSYQGTELNAVLGPIDSWQVPETPHAWQMAEGLRWRRFARESTPGDGPDVRAQLGQAQLDALSTAGRWRLIERLYAYLQDSFPEPVARIDQWALTGWFEARLAEADAFGLSSDRGLAVWVEYSLRWGPEFTRQPNGPYQQWLARTPDAFKLAPELRIQRMDQDCLHIELNKDAP